MKYKDLPFFIKRRAKRNLNNYFQRIGLEDFKKELSEGGNLLNMFDFSQTPEGFEFWSACDHFEDVATLKASKPYKDFYAKRFGKNLYNFYFVLSLLFYATVAYWLGKMFIPAEILSKIFIR